MPPLEQGHPLFPSNIPLKIEIRSSPFFEYLVAGSIPSAEKGGGGGLEV